MERLDIMQVHQRLLNMAIVVNDICKKHGIPLYMISGTMLGAVRHKGFIPWDDDMDFAVPYQYFDKLISILRYELPHSLFCLTYDQSTTYQVPWLKIEDSNTLVIDHSLEIEEENMPGLTLDIFPLVSCDKCKSSVFVKRIQRLLRMKRFIFSHNEKFMKGILKTLVKKTSIISPQIIVEKIFQYTALMPSGDDYIIPMDPNYSNRYFSQKWFTPLTKFQFENTFFFGVSEYNKYLSLLYGDYMKLPSEDKRRVHCDNVYLK